MSFVLGLNFVSTSVVKMASSDTAIYMNVKISLEPRPYVPTVCMELAGPASQDGLQSDLAKDCCPLSGVKSVCSTSAPGIADSQSHPLDVPCIPYVLGINRLLIIVQQSFPHHNPWPGQSNIPSDLQAASTVQHHHPAQSSDRSCNAYVQMPKP